MQVERMKNLRIKRGYSQENLAVMVDVRGQQIWRYESGYQTPSAEILARIAQALETTTDYLLGLEEDPAPRGAPVGLSGYEWAIIGALRRGDLLAAIRLIVVKE